MHFVDYILNSLRRHKVWLHVGKWKDTWPALIRRLRELNRLCHPVDKYNDEELPPKDALSNLTPPVVERNNNTATWIIPHSQLTLTTSTNYILILFLPVFLIHVLLISSLPLEFRISIPPYYFRILYIYIYIYHSHFYTGVKHAENINSAIFSFYLLQKNKHNYYQWSNPVRWLLLFVKFKVTLGNVFFFFRPVLVYLR